MTKSERTVLRWNLEQAEVEYLKARKRGLVNPVVGITCPDVTLPRRVMWDVNERADMAMRLDAGGHPEAAAKLRAGPDPARPFSSVIATPRGVTVVDRPAPE